MNQELDDLRTQSSHVPCDHTHPVQGDFPQRGTAALAQQLSFAGATGEGEGDRLVELATQVEDLKYQVSSLTEQLEEAVTQTNTAAVSKPPRYLNLNHELL